MRLEQDYDSVVAACMVFVTVALSVVNPFSPAFTSQSILPVLSPVPFPGPLAYSPSLAGTFIRNNLIFESYLLSTISALALFFRVMAFSNVADIESGAYSGLLLLPGGRKTMFLSTVLSGTVIPYLAGAVPVAAVVSVSQGLGLADSIALVTLNFVPMMGLTAVTLGSGVHFKRSSHSAGVGLLYLSILAALLGISALTGNVYILFLAAMFFPSAALGLGYSAALNWNFLHPLLQVSSSPSMVTVAEILVAGTAVNAAMLYLLYVYWVRYADF